MPESPPIRRRGLLVAGGLLAALFILGYVAAFLLTPFHGRSSVVEIEIRRGDTFSAVARELADKGVISHPRLFVLWAWLHGFDTRVHRGLYRFEGAVSPRSVLDGLVRGRTVVHKVTIPEGFTVRQIGRLLEGKGLVAPEGFASAVSEPAVLASLGTGSMEGYLFPSTYLFRALATEEEIVKTMFTEFKDTFTAEMEARARKLGMTRHQLVTLASIIEKETGVPDERGIVAGVFINRLREGMPLQTDPTVIYGITNGQGSLDRGLRQSELRAETPYNTYLFRGLPPTPIANPGLASIKAALAPEETSFLFFVADGNGGHAFAATLKEHNANVVRWRAIQSERAVE